MNEIRRFWIINYRNVKKIVLSIALNMLIISAIVFLMENENINTYIVAYSIVWVLLSVQISFYKGILEDKKSKTIKYYFIENNSMVYIYFIRYSIICLKNIIIFGCLLDLAYLLKVIYFSVNVIDILVFYLGLWSLFFIDYTICIINLLNKKIQTALNVFKCILLYTIMYKKSIFLPASYAIRRLGDNLLAGHHMKTSEVGIVLINACTYVLVGLFFTKWLTKKSKYSIVS
ncbi:hypothetical protein SAMN02910358_02376 [Lachnospiraceae bacterium XBB1006]|nr:hypothetical protein SAMN02910358_02376 [Lachnospiraceae bacterium XBB1006]